MFSVDTTADRMGSADEVRRPSRRLPAKSLSVAGQKSVLAKANMLLSQFTAITQQLSITCNVMSDMTRLELLRCLVDMKGDFLNLATIQRKIFQICDYARSVQAHQISFQFYKQLIRSRGSCFLYIQEKSNLSSRECCVQLTDYERDMRRYQPIRMKGRGAELRRGLSRRVVDKYQLKEQASNFKLLTSQVVADQRHLQMEIDTINTYFFGVNDKASLQGRALPLVSQMGSSNPPLSPRSRSTIAGGLSSGGGCSTPSLSQLSTPSLSRLSTPSLSPLRHTNPTDSGSTSTGIRALRARSWDSVAGRDSSASIQELMISGCKVQDVKSVSSAAGESELRSRFAEAAAEKKMLSGVKVLGNSMNCYIRNKPANSQFSKTACYGDTERLLHHETFKPPVYKRTGNKDNTLSYACTNGTTAPTLPISAAEEPTISCRSSAGVVRSKRPTSHPPAPKGTHLKVTKSSPSPATLYHKSKPWKSRKRPACDDLKHQVETTSKPCIH